MPELEFKVLLAPTLALAQALPQAAITVEAEYGATVVEGTRYTAAHHQASGPYVGRHVLPGGRCSPCNDPHIPDVHDGETILVSHVDLDTIGGVLRSLPGSRDLFASGYASFWELAEFVDVTGPHKMEASVHSTYDKKRLRAFWVWSRSVIPRVARDQVTDLTELFQSVIPGALAAILAGDPAMIARGEAMRSTEAALEATSFAYTCGPVVVRQASEFVNSLYNHQSVDGMCEFAAVAARNTDSGAITISLADPIEGVSCRDIVQSLWGPEAGGHAGIAGSPRGQVTNHGDLERVAIALANAIASCSGRRS